MAWHAKVPAQQFIPARGIRLTQALVEVAGSGPPTTAWVELWVDGWLLVASAPQPVLRPGWLRCALPTAHLLPGLEYGLRAVFAGSPSPTKGVSTSLVGL